MTAHGHSDDVTPAECADFLEQIVYLIDNELSSADREAVKAHIESCNPCLEKYDLQRTVKQVVARSCSEVAPGDLKAKILLRLQQVRVEIDQP